MTFATAQFMERRNTFNGYALLFGLGVHLLALAMLLLARSPEGSGEPPAIQLDLTPYLSDQPRARRLALSQDKSRTPAEHQHVQASEREGASGGREAGEATSSSTIGEATSFPPPSFMGALRQSVGCSHADYAKLSALERSACDRQFAGRPRQEQLAKAFANAMDPQNGTDDLAREGRYVQAQKTYREAPGAGGFTSLRCNLFHQC